MTTRLHARLHRLRLLLTRRRVNDELSDELRWHHEMLSARYIEQGMTPDEARLAATRQLGNVTRVREDVHEMNSVSWLETLAQDVRQAARLFARTPSIAGSWSSRSRSALAPTARFFSIAYSVCSSRCRMPIPTRSTVPRSSFPSVASRCRAFPSACRRFSRGAPPSPCSPAMAALTPWEASVTGDGEPERLGGARVSDELLCAARRADGCRAGTSRPMRSNPATNAS